jgi:hypothetical protein
MFLLILEYRPKMMMIMSVKRGLLRGDRWERGGKGEDAWR